MIRILCYGDSNTWGYIPGTGERFDDNVRWTGMMQHFLGAEFKVIEEGLSGRTTAFDNERDWTKNGSKLLLPMLETHAPLDLVVLMLGTNDVKAQFGVTTEKIARNISYLVRAIQRSNSGRRGSAPNVLLIAPPPLGKLEGEVAIEFGGGAEKSQRFAQTYKAVAEQCGCDFLDAGSIIRSSDLDGVHFDEGDHRKFGEAVSQAIQSIVST
jgi:lysophospholipase L1-like esterase